MTSLQGQEDWVSEIGKDFINETELVVFKGEFLALLCIFDTSLLTW